MAVISQGCGHRPLIDEVRAEQARRAGKPLAVGDLVRKRKPMVVTLVGDGVVWTEGGLAWTASDLERIDPAPPVDSAASLAREVLEWLDREILEEDDVIQLRARMEAVIGGAQ